MAEAVCKPCVTLVPVVALLAVPACGVPSHSVRGA